MKKGQILQEDKTILSVCLTTKASNEQQKKNLTESNGEIGKSTIIVCHFNNPLQVIDQAGRNKQGSR
jgi:hypothetical protein